jgi:hypothetical protein
VAIAGERERLRLLFRIFGEQQCRGYSPVYEALSAAVAAGDELLDLVLDSAARDQRRPSLLFGAVSLLLASRPDAELAAYYPVHGGDRAPDEGLVPAFAGFCAEYRDELARVMADGATQTNEIRRCVALRLGLAHVQRQWPGPVALVEAGASAGLNLLFDRYRYQVGGHAGPVADGPAADTPVTIACDLRGDDPGQVLGTVPGITARLGIDLRPVDLADPRARAWLAAFIWPEQTGDLATLRGAIGLTTTGRAGSVGPGARTAAAGHPELPAVPVVRGDATADTARLIAGLPGDEPVAFFTASLLSYLGPGARQAFADQLGEAARHRPVAWIFAESPGLLKAAGLRVTALDGPLSRRNTRYVIGASVRQDGNRGDVMLALADPYLRWVAPARHPDDDFQWVTDES